MTQPTQCHLEPASAWSDFSFSDVLVRVSVGSHLFSGGSSLRVNTHPTTSGSDVPLLTGVLMASNMEQRVEAWWVLDLACSQQAGLLEFLVRNVISV